MSLVSVIIPTFNRAHLINETLDSVLGQTYANWECIIVDDGSTDETESIIKEYVKKDNRFQYYIRPNEKAKGSSSCRNFGIEKSKGEFVLFLDSDDLLSEVCLENRLRFVKENNFPDLSVFTTQMFYDKIEHKLEIFNAKLQNYSKESYLEHFLKGGYPFCVMSVLWKKEVLLQLGGFDERMTVLEDPDLHIRALDEKIIVATNLDGLIDNFYRKGSNQRELDANFYNNWIKSALIMYSKKMPTHSTIMKDTVLKFFKNAVFEKGDVVAYFKYYSLLLKNNVFSVKQIIGCYVLGIIKLLKLGNFKGIGIYKFKKYLFRK